MHVPPVPAYTAPAPPPTAACAVPLAVEPPAGRAARRLGTATRVGASVGAPCDRAGMQSGALVAARGAVARGAACRRAQWRGVARLLPACPRSRPRAGAAALGGHRPA